MIGTQRDLSQENPIDTNQIKKNWESINKIMIICKINFKKDEMTCKPRFRRAARLLKDQTIYLKGYFDSVAVEETNHKQLIFSDTPYQHFHDCDEEHYCTVLKVNNRESIPLTDKLVTIKAILRLDYNDNPISFYTLDDVEIIQETNQN